MFGSLKISQRRLTLISVLCFLIFLGVCIVMLRAAAPDSVTVGEKNISLSVGSDADIDAFLAEFGCVAGERISDREITVPKTWNDVYTAYNELQREQGLDLVPYKGESARELVTALEGADDCATLLISGGRIIAAHLSGMKYGDPLRPLIK